MTVSHPSATLTTVLCQTVVATCAAVLTLGAVSCGPAPTAGDAPPAATTTTFEVVCQALDCPTP